MNNLIWRQIYNIYMYIHIPLITFTNYAVIFSSIVMECSPIDYVIGYRNIPAARLTTYNIWFIRISQVVKIIM